MRALIREYGETFVVLLLTLFLCLVLPIRFSSTGWYVYDKPISLVQTMPLDRTLFACVYDNTDKKADTFGTPVTR